MSRTALAKQVCQDTEELDPTVDAMLARAELCPILGETRRLEEGNGVKITLRPTGSQHDYVVSNDGWVASGTKEKELQAAIVCLTGLFNELGDRTLCYDFGINGQETLGSFKPDGHGRTQQSDLHRTNILQHAVLVELKVRASLGKLDSKGKTSFMLSN